jgi:uncharacterized protein (DUF2164 family)
MQRSKQMRDRLEKAVEIFVENMSLEQMIEYICDDVLKHYNKECNEEEIKSFITAMECNQ